MKKVLLFLAITLIFSLMTGVVSFALESENDDCQEWTRLSGVAGDIEGIWTSGSVEEGLYKLTFQTDEDFSISFKDDDDTTYAANGTYTYNQTEQTLSIYIDADFNTFPEDSEIVDRVFPSVNITTTTFTSGSCNSDPSTEDPGTGNENCINYTKQHPNNNIDIIDTWTIPTQNADENMTINFYEGEGGFFFLISLSTSDVVSLGYK